MEGVAEEEEVDDQLLWNLQILSEVRMYLFFYFYFFALLRHFGYSCTSQARSNCLVAQTYTFYNVFVDQTFLTQE